MKVSNRTAALLAALSVSAAGTASAVTDAPENRMPLVSPAMQQILEVAANEADDPRQRRDRRRSSRRVERGLEEPSEGGGTQPVLRRAPEQPVISPAEQRRKLQQRARSQDRRLPSRGEGGTAVADPCANRRPVGEDGRRRTSRNAKRIDGSRPDLDPCAVVAGDQPQQNPNSRNGLNRIPPPPGNATYDKTVVGDRWVILDDLGLRQNRWWDPYGRNTLKGDSPIHDDWFLSVLVTSDTTLEPRAFPLPVGPQGTDTSGRLNVIGSDGDQFIFNQNLIAGLVYYKGDTVFRPPDYEYRITLALNYNKVFTENERVLLADPGQGTDRRDNHIGVQELFADKHLRNIGDRYDFDSLRIGIQPVTVDFRGFLFQDLQLGIRLFGTRDNNIFQYNLAWFRRIEKDTNSGLNDIGVALRKDDVFFFNLFWQDYPTLGYQSQGVVVYNRNREGDNGSYFNTNNLIERPASLGLEQPRNYDVVYLGYNGDGHFGRLNMTNSIYYAVGHESRGVFTPQKTRISAFFAATEMSVDFSWNRIRFQALYASGDDDPYDDKATGFDAIFENPLFAGYDTSFWGRQNVPLIGGGRVAVSQRNGLLNNLRSSKEEGQSNFANPGTVIMGFGSDHDISPEFRVSTNVNHIWFATTEIVEAARNQGNIDEAIGWDLSVATIYRPFATQNVVLRASAATLLPGDGYKALYGDDETYTVFINLLLNY